MDAMKTDWMQTNIFTYVVIIVCAFILGILIANAVYFRRIADSTTSSAIPKDQARNMFYFNLVMIIFVGLVFAFAVFRAIVGIARYNQIRMATSTRIDQFGNWAVAPQTGLWPVSDPTVYQQIPMTVPQSQVTVSVPQPPQVMVGSPPTPYMMGSTPVASPMMPPANGVAVQVQSS